MGLALRDGYRDKVLLMTKLRDRTLDGIKRQLETSLKRFGLDSFDLMQFHDVGRLEGDVDAIYQNGLIEWAEEMRSQGVFKYIGFTSHAVPTIAVDMIERGYTWDTMQICLNPGDFHRSVSFEKDVLPLALAHQLLSPYTSFVAVEEVVSRPVAEPSGRVPVPNTRPKGQSPQGFAYPRTATTGPAKAWLGMLLLFLAMLMRVLRQPEVDHVPGAGN